MWVFGNNSRDKVYFILENNYGMTYKKEIGHLNYNGWKKLNVEIGLKINQMNLTLNKESYIKIKKIAYEPSKKQLKNRWNFIYFDDISAQVRKKYLDRKITKMK